MFPHGNMADKSTNCDNIYTANSFSWKDEANGLEYISILKFLIILMQHGQLNQVSSISDTCDKNILIEIKAYCPICICIFNEKYGRHAC